MRRWTLAAFLILAWNLDAQPDRILGKLDSSHTVILPGNRRVEAQPRYDQGPADPALRIDGMMLVLKKSPAQEVELQKLLADQQDASSPEFHRWLTPAQFAERFGASRSDVAKIADWLTSEGFRVDYQAQGRNWILFSGTAGQVNQTFRAPIHMYRVDGETHFANAADPSIPAALEPLALTLMGLDDFYPRAPRTRIRPAETSPSGGHYLVPGDMGIIYDIAPLWSQGYDGTGIKIAVIAQDTVDMSDVALFRSHYGLPANDPQTVLVPGGGTPSSAGSNEPNLDLEWAGAIAPKATLIFVNSHSAHTSSFYAIDQDLAPVITYSFESCEAKISGGASSASANQAEAQKANAEGITWLAASGDQGAAGCDPKTGSLAQYGLSVSSPSSIPEVTAVGGTTFNEGSGTYWNSSNATDRSSATGYIPEQVWNDSQSTPSIRLDAGGGGVSIFYPKPAWQTGPGVPNDQQRDTPDISFTASPNHDGYWYASGGVVQCCIGGTSASTPVFAGIVALLNHYLVANKVQSQPGLGNINPMLYTLAQTTPGIFHDVTVGSNIVPCQVGTKDCPNGTLGYSAGPGYDLASGLGSADAYKLVTQWNQRPPAATTTTLAASPASISVTASTTITATVKAKTGTATPTGSVSFSAGSATLGSAKLAGSAGTATASMAIAGNQLAVGNNTISASYGGDTGFSPSSASLTVAVTVPTATSAVIPSIIPNPVYEQTPDADGYAWFYTVKLTEIAGVGTTLTGFSIDGTDYSSSIVSFFGTASLPAKGTLSVSLKTKLASVPVTRVFVFSGADASGTKWTQQISVPFYGPQYSAALAVSSSPATVILKPNSAACPADFPYYQEIDLQEKNGYEVYLTGFFDDGEDDSDEIEYWFGSWRLAPLGSLQADICWAMDGPKTVNFEIDGVDSQGNDVSATMSVSFQNAAQTPGKLSVSADSLDVAAKSGQSASATLQVTVPAGQQWTLSIFPANQRTSWLTVSPQSGAGPGSVTVKASGAGLANGAYVATLVFQCVNTMPQFVNVPVTFSNGLSATTAIGGVTNGASFAQAAAPGMIMSVFGANLTNSKTLSASTLPLPLTLGGVSATVNGVPAPLYFVSPGQLNIQVPYETPVGDAMLNVNNNGEVAALSFAVSDSAPGIFVGSGNALVPIASARRGQAIILFMTGEGDVYPWIATGASPPLSTPLDQLPSPRLDYSLTVAGITVKPDFIGIPYYLVGATQINFTIPQNAPLGTQSVVVTIGGNSSAAAKINVTQ